MAKSTSKKTPTPKPPNVATKQKTMPMKGKTAAKGMPTPRSAQGRGR